MDTIDELKILEEIELSTFKIDVKKLSDETLEKLVKLEPDEEGYIHYTKELYQTVLIEHLGEPKASEYLKFNPFEEK